MPRRKVPHRPDMTLDQLLSGTKTTTVFNRGGLLGQLR